MEESSRFEEKTVEGMQGSTDEDTEDFVAEQPVELLVGNGSQETHHAEVEHISAQDVSQEPASIADEGGSFEAVELESEPSSSVDSARKRDSADISGEDDSLAFAATGSAGEIPDDSQEPDSKKVRTDNEDVTARDLSESSLKAKLLSRKRIDLCLTACRRTGSPEK